VSTPVAFLVGLGLLAGNAFFVAAEFSLLAVRESRLEQLSAEGSKRAASALAGKRQLSLMLAGAQLGITICSLLLGAIAEPAVVHLLEGWIKFANPPEALTHTIAFAIGLAIVVFLHMVVGEMAPKSWAIADPERSTMILVTPFRLFALVVKPLIAVLNWMANGLVRLLGVEPQDERAMAHSAGDLLFLLRESADAGSIGDDERALYARSIRLPEIDAADAMVPRRKVVYVTADQTASDIAAAARESGRSRFPVCEGDLDHVVGVAHVKDVIALDESVWDATTAIELSQPPFVTHEHKALEDLLVEMRARRQHLAIVVDEHGIVSGIITLEDVIERLIGDFYDESDTSTDVRRQFDGTWVLSGDLSANQFTERTGIELPEGEWSTVAGFVIDTLDRIPKIGDEVVQPGFKLLVQGVDNFAVTELRLVIQSSNDDTTDEAPSGEA
jgi:CBS domain containing-hemolysin-like protein